MRLLFAGKPSVVGQKSPSPDDQLFQYLAQIYSKNHPRMLRGSSCDEESNHFENGITNGAEWYAQKGKNDQKTPEML